MNVIVTPSKTWGSTTWGPPESYDWRLSIDPWTYVTGRAQTEDAAQEEGEKMKRRLVGTDVLLARAEAAEQRAEAAEAELKRLRDAT